MQVKKVPWIYFFDCEKNQRTFPLALLELLAPAEQNTNLAELHCLRFTIGCRKFVVGENVPLSFRSDG